MTVRRLDRIGRIIMRQFRKLSIGAGLFTAALLIGCGLRQDAGNDESRAEQHVIRWMVYGEKSKSSDGVITAFNERLQEFFPDTTVEFEIVPIQYYQDKWNMKMATNETLDLVWIGNDIFNYSEEVKKGGFMALDYLLSTNGQALLADIPQELWQQQKRDGKIYSVPLMGPLYRKDYALVTAKRNMLSYEGGGELADTNLQILYSDAACYEAVEDYLCYLKEAQVLGTGVSCDTFGAVAQKGYESIYGPDSPFVIKIFDGELTVYNKYELDSYTSYFEAMQRWYEKGYIRADIEEVLDPEKDNGTKTGNAIYLDEYGESGVVLDLIPTEYEAVRIPLQDYKYIAYESCRNAVAIPRTTADPKRAMQIINLLNSKDGQELVRLLCNGFEGRHYVRKAGEQIDRVTGTTGRAIYSLSPYAVGNVFFNYENTRGEFEQLKKYNEKAIRSPLMGFELDTRMIVMEMAKIDLVVEEYIDMLERGTARDWREVYDEMIGKMKEAGADKVIGEMQKQINQFLETKDTKLK